MIKAIQSYIRRFRPTLCARCGDFPPTPVLSATLLKEKTGALLCPTLVCSEPKPQEFHDQYGARRVDAYLSFPPLARVLDEHRGGRVLIRWKDREELWWVRQSYHHGFGVFVIAND